MSVGPQGLLWSLMSVTSLNHHVSLSKCRHEEALPLPWVFSEASIGHRGRLHWGWSVYGHVQEGHLATGAEQWEAVVSGLYSILAGSHHLSALAYTFIFKIWKLEWESSNEFSVLPF